MVRVAPELQGVSMLAVGTHTISACYGGSPNFEASDGTVSQVVNKAPTATTVLSSANPSVFSQTVTFSVTVSPVAPAVATPVGDVTLMNGTCERWHPARRAGRGERDRSGQLQRLVARREHPHDHRVLRGQHLPGE